MSQDMKPRKTPPARKSGGSTLLGLFIGLVIGVIGVAGVVWYINKAPLPFTTTGQQPKLPPPVASKTPPAASPEVPPVASAPVALPGKPGDPIGEKPRFDFYKILPGKAEAIPDPKPEEAKPAEARPTAGKPTETKPIEAKAGEAKPADGKPADSKPADSKAASSKTAEAKAADSKPAESAKSKADNTLKDPIYLQAGSFQSASDADNQKARLALLGAEARIQQVMLQDKVWYRVRIGPYHKMDDVNHLRADLARQGIDANVVKKD
ncbi:MAG: SPOR domain-containing protein [Candidatus Accumulibacter sp.]|uniref:SPOR domain-containing protein n=1 Tax=Candidatus Accumulibacter affinis TaxID=2954384 RepID=A0A935T9N2_9PROT|nr:SPOR domain-containing protein [Candidatus Accumulibacter affinis]MBP9806304.1 SPOR domain-containing protein [Accumulibacter sp.]